MEKYKFNKESVDKNISNILNTASYMYESFNIKSKLMVVPTSIAFYKNDLPNFYISDNQKDSLDYINNNISNNDYLNFYTPYDILSKNRISICITIPIIIGLIRCLSFLFRYV